ncbi:MAG: hypothetical protein HOP19_06480 [Acidobacteria bacterium]|nr:hypothetical protein [Acidobacteriota bacterium]
MTEETNQAWEQELTDRLQAALTRRNDTLRAEWDRLEQAIAAARANVTNADTTNEAPSLVAHVGQLIKDQATQAEATYEARLAQELEKVRAEITHNVRQTLEADFDRKLAQANAAHGEAQTQITQLQAQLTAAASVAAVAAAPAAAAPVDFTPFKAAVEDIDAQRTQSETLNALLRSAARFAPRIAFFVVKGNDAVGWKATGFQNGLNEETVRLLTVSMQAPNLLSQALTTQTAAVALNPPATEISKVLGNFADLTPRGAVAVPLVVRGKAAAVLYADSADGGDDAIQLEAIETLIHVASMGIELLPVRRNLDPTPRVTAPAPTAPVAALVEAPAPVVEPPPAPVAAPATAPAPTFDTPSFNLTANPAFAATRPPVTAETPVVEVPAPKLPDTAPVVMPAEAVSEAPQPITAPLEAPPVVDAPTELVDVAAEQEKTSNLTIFEKLRAGIEEKERELTSAAAPPVPVVEEAVPVTPSVPPAPTNALEAPTWMRRLESPEVVGANSLADAPSIRPATPPPMHKPSLANWGAKEREVETPAPAVPPPAPAAPAPVFQAETPSLKVTTTDVTPNFNVPSEPPRYAAPSLSVSTAASETEVRAHNDARRFARLLISEIKLYNAAKVNEGRRNGDLYDRLRDEIDRSRKVYDKRVSPTVAGKFDYFYDELVQTLAEGDPSKLGETCPGPFVVAA